MATHACLVRHLWGELGRAPDPAGTRAGSVEVHGSSKHVGHIDSLHCRHIGEAGSTLMPWMGAGGAGGFAEELHCTRTRPPQYFKGDCAERVSREVVIHGISLALVVVPESSSMAEGACG
jgi:hypothetical protein